MKKATKAMLLSGLVFPGLGQLYLKRWVTGVLLTGIAAYALYVVASVTLSVTRDVAQKIESGAVSADIDTVTQLVNQQLSGSAQASSTATLAFGVCWIVGIVTAFWQGRAQDKREARDRLI
jgi:TM2 domain-containing membrane protein YozV